MADTVAASTTTVDRDLALATLLSEFHALDLADVVAMVLDACGGHVAEARENLAIMASARRSSAMSGSRVRRSRRTRRRRSGRPQAGMESSSRGDVGGGDDGDDAGAQAGVAGDGAAKCKRKHREKGNGKGKGKGKGRVRKPSRRKKLRIAEQNRLEALKRARLSAGATEDEFMAEVEADGRSKLIATGNTAEINVITPPRPGAKLLVLDLDETLYDFRSADEKIAHKVLRLKRPHVDAFLAKAYTYGYDLCIWSQSSWRRLETILTALGLLTHEAFKFVFVLDVSSMYNVSRTDAQGNIVVHQVKDLHFIWGKFPDFYTPCNTLHIDDLARNMCMNPGNGLVIKPFNRKLRRSAVPDNTLALLADYLFLIAHEPDISLLNHAGWELAVVQARSPRPEKPSNSASSDTTNSGLATGGRVGDEIGYHNGGSGGGNTSGPPPAYAAHENESGVLSGRGSDMGTNDGAGGPIGGVGRAGAGGSVASDSWSTES
ncbi:ubiquitin family protein [Thecamonas trahens ATCC 50062]|uniref:Ubiquitin family protein n=1 Tax=Thecamonas trahens ATCC 50062 TaxID=461836 RepID=A0A0L0DCE2_THETB|nr:ubiquitin family protein [Thecamonas trahens ATCC 50062]KNC49756.1 ubiquitin family protein [Thecamonas trahens ATCC 50062]|eukprot:XP_013757542.1 ubiquitin family protein [Thecamonas trahens ATCC 50062]